MAATSRLQTPTFGYMPAGCGVDHDLRPAVDSLLIGELAFGGVGLPADSQDLGRALVAGDGAGGVVGAAGAEDEDRAGP